MAQSREANAPLDLVTFRITEHSLDYVKDHLETEFLSLTINCKITRTITHLKSKSMSESVTASNQLRDLLCSYVLYSFLQNHEKSA